jgi:hypothetical protein
MESSMRGVWYKANYHGTIFALAKLRRIEYTGSEEENITVNDADKYT